MADAHDLPLFAWGDALRRDRRRRAGRRLRVAIVATSIACLAGTIVAPPLPRLIWNASASVPIGFYTVVPDRPVRPGDMVAARLPLSMRALASRRHYLPATVPLVKRIAAVPGDSVCALGDGILVNGRIAARRHETDRAGRPMPWWQGCMTLRDGALFLLMAGTPDSFDGRYFGATEAKDVIGRARLIWAP